MFRRKLSGPSRGLNAERAGDDTDRCRKKASLLKTKRHLLVRRHRSVSSALTETAPRGARSC